MNFMSSLKAAWHIERIKALREGKNIVPTHLQLIISDLCNQNCHFCAYRMDSGFSTELFGGKNPPRFIPEPKAIEILDDYARMGGKSVEFTGGGEPTAHPRCFEIIRHAQNIGLQTGLVTNAVRLKDCEALRDLDWLRISLDAGTEETYERIRESKQWPKVLENLSLAGRLEKPRVGVGFVVTRENHLEIAQALEIVKKSGIEYMRVSAMFSTMGEDYYEGLDVNVPDDPQVVNFFENRVQDLRDGRPDYSFCGEQQFVLYIGGDQCIYTCCTNAYTTLGKIGDLKETTFEEWLKTYNRRNFDARSCHHCQFNEKNRVINYLLEENPEHVDFV